MLLQTQYGIFFCNPIARPDLLVQQIASRYGSYFDASPIILPIPNEIINFPSVQLKSADKKWHLDASRIRADIIFKPDEAKPSFNHIRDELAVMQKMLLALADEARDQKVDITRVTAIGKLVINKENPTQFLQESFLKNEADTFKEVMLRLNVETHEETLTCNNIYNYTNGHLTRNADGTTTPAVVVTRDFNTDPTIHTTLANEQLEEFFRLVDKHVYESDIIYQKI